MTQTGSGLANLPRRVGLTVQLGGTAALVCGALALYAGCGGVAWQALLSWAAAGAAIWLPGCVLSGKNHSIETALVWGSTAFVGVTLAASVLQMRWLAVVWLLVWLAAGAAGLARRAVRQKTADRLRAFAAGQGPTLCLIWAVLVFANALWSVRYAHPTAVGALQPSQDFFWNLGNTQSFALGFPLADLRVSGVTVTYHFLTELYQAGLWFALGGLVPAYDIVAFYSFAPLAAALVAGLYALGRHLWPDCRPHPLLLAAMPLWLCCASMWKALPGGSRFGNAVMIHTLSNINGQATAYLFLALTLLFLDRLLRTGLQAKPGQWAAAAAAFYLLTFSKSPEAAILAIALACVLALMLLQRRLPLKQAAVLLLLIPVGFAVLYKFYFAAGADSSMSFSLTGTIKLFYFSGILNALQIRFPAFWQGFVPLLWAAQAVLMAPAACLAWLWAALQAVARRLKAEGSHLLWHACIAGGLLAFYLFDHYSSSQIYFANLAVFCMGLFLLESLPALVQGRGVLRRAVQAGMAALLLAGGVTMACLGVFLGQTAAQLLIDPPHSETRQSLTAGEEDACLWLAQQMQPHELFATNRMHTGAALEGLSNVYTGLTGRRAYMESFKYAVSNMGERAGDVMTRYDQMNELFHPDTTEARLQQLCAQCGISYLIYNPGQPGSESQLACFERVYQNADCTIYRVAP